MFQNFTKLAAQKAAEGASRLAGAVSSQSKIQQEYEIREHVASVGVLRVHSARPKQARQGGLPDDAKVSVWLFDKKSVAEEARTSPKEYEALLESIRADSKQLSRLKHPGILRIIVPLEESRQHIAFVTEAVKCDLSTELTRSATEQHVLETKNSMSYAKHAAGTEEGRLTRRRSDARGRTMAGELDALELKYGLHSVLKTLQFMHGSHLAHCNVSPGTIIVTASGDWKLACLGFVAPFTEASSAGVVANATHVFALLALAVALLVLHERRLLLFQRSHGTKEGCNAQQAAEPWNVVRPVARYAYDSPRAAVARGHASHERHSYESSQRTRGWNIRPALSYTAPELVDGVGDAAITGVTDAFSVACLLYYALRRQTLLRVDTTSEYCAALSSVHLIPMDGVPDDLAALIRRCLTADTARRPRLPAFLEAPFFRADRLLRALCFMDGVLQRDQAQKHAFLSDLPSFYRQFSKPILHRRVLPCLLQQWQDAAMRDAVLPLILAMSKDLPVEVFQEKVLPELKFILASAYGPQLCEVFRAMPTLQGAMRADQVEDIIVPVLIKAMQDGDTLLQEEALKAMRPLLETVSIACLAKLLEQLNSVCRRTRSASIRSGALDNLAACVPRMGQPEFTSVVGMLGTLTSFDKTEATLLHAFAICEALSATKSAEITATTLLPLATPWLAARGLKPTAFQTLMTGIHQMLARVKEWYSRDSSAAQRGEAATWDEGVQQAPSPQSAANGLDAKAAPAVPAVAAQTFPRGMPSHSHLVSHSSSAACVPGSGRPEPYAAGRAATSALKAARDPTGASTASLGEPRSGDHLTPSQAQPQSMRASAALGAQVGMDGHGMTLPTARRAADHANGAMEDPFASLATTAFAAPVAAAHQIKAATPMGHAAQQPRGYSRGNGVPADPFAALGIGSDAPRGIPAGKIARTPEPGWDPFS